jgi:hypothetical protein
MTTKFTVLNKTIVDRFTDSVSINDVVSYRLDCSPWAYDNADVSSATWVVERGSASVSEEAVALNVVSANVTFSQAGKVLISVTLSTADGLVKKIWLEMLVRGETESADDYGISS